ncbi:MAG: helix-turn-helix domain-containing protein [Solirubrobacterales bacterium]|nr:helix-turn-helix domain-containing protein [Solirubrobacterales bacterium]
MAAYASSRLEFARTSPRTPSNPSHVVSDIDPVDGGSLLDALIDQLAARVAERLGAVAPGFTNGDPSPHDDWFDSRHAADYLGIHRDTLRKLAAERAIPSEQDGPNCKLYFRRADLDAWRRSGGRPRHLAATLPHAA